MRTSNLHFLIITLACILFACKDNNDIEPDANDAFVGSQRLITLSSEMDKFSGTDFECVIKAEDGTIFRRRGNHMRSGNTSLLTLDTGLRTGTYRLLALEVPTIEKRHRHRMDRLRTRMPRAHFRRKPFRHGARHVQFRI